MSTKQKLSSTLLLIFAFVLLSFNFLQPTTKSYAQHFVAIEITPEFNREVQCLAENIYYEAGTESYEGKLAVAQVTLNRAASGKFPDSICGVVKQKSIINGYVVCQFSWFCTPFKNNKDSEAYQQSKQVALYVYANYENLRDITKGALYYHADYINPRWKLEKTTVIGRHIFYKENGKYYDAKNESAIERGTVKTLFSVTDGGNLP